MFSKLVFKNKMLSLSIFLILLYILLNIYKKTDTNTFKLNDNSEPINTVSLQIENHMKQDNENVYIDNDILTGKLQLPDVHNVNPPIPLSNEIEYIDVSNQITLEDLQKAGGIAFPNDYTQFQKFDPKILKYSVQPTRAYPALDMYPRNI